MANPPEFMLADPAFVKMLMEAITGPPVQLSHNFFAKPPRFKELREIHARRARKLRRRGEYVHFLRWEHGHCIYGWGGPVPETFTLHRMPRKKSEPVYTQICHLTNFVVISSQPGERT